MRLIRALTIGLLAGSVGALIFDPRGDGINHVRLALLTGLFVGQLLTVPVSLVAGGVWAYARRSRPARPCGFPLATLILAFGGLVATQAWAVEGWLSTEPTPGGVGDPDGEFSIALLTSLSGCLAVAVGLVVLVYRCMQMRTRSGT